MAKQQTRFDEVVRTAWGRAFIALVVAAGVAAAWWRSFLYFRDDLQFPELAYPVGAIMAILGYLLVGQVFRSGGRKAAPTKLSRGALDGATDRLLGGLSHIQYRVHPIGHTHSWPKAVVSPTGVYIVTPTQLPGSLGSSPDGQPLINGQPGNEAVFGASRRMSESVRVLLNEQHDIAIPVIGLTVVDSSVFIPAGLSAATMGALRLVRVDEIPAVIAEGAAVPPAVAQSAYEAIARWRPIT